MKTFMILAAVVAAFSFGACSSRETATTHTHQTTTTTGYSK